MNLSLFELLFKIYDSDVFYFILFEFMIKYYFLNNFVKICEYPHNRYPINIGTCTQQILILRVGYEGATTRILPAL